MIRITKENITGEHAVVEMMLSSLFDNSYSSEKYGVIASNGHLEYTYIKGPTGFEMTVEVISLSKPKPKFALRFSGKPFELNTKHAKDFFDRENGF
jgi:hypothetical protein